MATVIRKFEHTRLTKPLIRENGQLREATWEEALTRAAQLFQDVKTRYGPNGLGVFSCSKSTNELNYLASKFSRVVFGTHNIDSCNRT